MVATKENEKLLMSLYAMQRANGDIFALDDHGRFRVPVFHSSHDAITARLRNFGMLLFKPVAVDARLLKEIIPGGGAAEVEFWLVDDPLINLNRGRLLPPRQLALLAGNGIKQKAAHVIQLPMRSPVRPLLRSTRLMQLRLGRMKEACIRNARNGGNRNCDGTVVFI